MVCQLLDLQDSYWCGLIINELLVTFVMANVYFHTNLPDETLIRQTAYYIWLRNDGCPDNCAIEHWYEAYLSLCLNTGRIASTLGSSS
jgi:hypothetical protein